MRKNKKKLEIFMTAMILAISFYIGRLGAGIVASGKMQYESGMIVEDKKITVVIDAGHGGIDDGKVGVNKAMEKEVNLSIAQVLESMLENEGVKVIMTRKDNNGLYDEGESNKKQQDLKRRCTLINESGALLAVSIHQNSYTDSSVKGPQVFFYKSSKEGGRLASILQTSLNESLEIERPRECKANDSYYLLRKTTPPTVIAECGFLSNAEEAKKLVTEEYQERVAKAICDGIMEYILLVKDE